MTEPIFDTVAIVGLGLIGFSVARGLKARGLARRVIGYDSSTPVHARAKELGFCDHVANTPAEAVKDAELVLIAVPSAPPPMRSSPSRRISAKAPSSPRSAR